MNVYFSVIKGATDMHKVLGGFLLVVTSLLAGCALSPQSIVLAPKVTVPAGVVALSGPITVTGYDERVVPWVGTRGGVYGGSNRINIGNNVQSAVKTAVEHALVEMGMTPGSTAKAPQFQVYVDQLKYQVPDSNYITKVDLKATVRVVVRANGKSYQGSYSAQEARRVFKAPSDEDNQEMVNDVLGDAIERAFEDPGLMRFMARI